MTRPRPRWRPYLNRIRLRRTDGTLFLDRWGVSVNALGGIMLHHITAPDPGLDLHDHPWSFLSVVLKGGYWEYRLPVRHAAEIARIVGADLIGTSAEVHRPRWSVRLMRLDECHRIVDVEGDTWTLCIRGPQRRAWGFYTPEGWMDEFSYDGSRTRDLFNEIG